MAKGKPNGIVINSVLPFPIFKELEALRAQRTPIPSRSVAICEAIEAGLAVIKRRKLKDALPPQPCSTPKHTVEAAKRPKHTQQEMAAT